MSADDTSGIVTHEPDYDVGPAAQGGLPRRTPSEMFGSGTQDRG